MIKKLKIFLFSALILCQIFSFCQEIQKGQEIFQAFISYCEYPSAENANFLYNILPACEKSFLLGPAIGNASFNQIKNTALHLMIYQALANDMAAIRLLFKLLPFSDGAYAESITETLGRVIRLNPQGFLEELKEHRNCFSDINSLLGNFQLDTKMGNTERADIYEFEMRIKALRSVNKQSLKTIRDECIDYLIRQLNRLKK